MSRETGGQAFPSIEETYVGDGVNLKTNIEGMTLRDYFAGQVLVGDLASYANPKCDNKDMESPEVIAGWCYEVADAMITERRAKHGGSNH